MTVGVVIPAYNEAPRISRVLQSLVGRVDEIVVVDDGSADGTAEVAEHSGASVHRLPENRGYKDALLHGLRLAKSDILVTLDADGEHRAEMIAALVGPIRTGKADLVLATRPALPRWSETAIARLTSLAVPTEDASTGLRAIRRDLAHRMTFPGPCLCGTLLLEAVALGARVIQFSLPPVPIEKPRRKSYVHGEQALHVATLIPRARKAQRSQPRVVTLRDIQELTP